MPQVMDPDIPQSTRRRGCDLVDGRHFEQGGGQRRKPGQERLDRDPHLDHDGNRDASGLRRRDRQQAGRGAGEWLRCGGRSEERNSAIAWQMPSFWGMRRAP